MRNRSPHLTRLASVPLFASLSTKDLEIVDRLGTHVRLESDAEVWRAGVTPPQFVVVLVGNLEISYDDRYLTTVGSGSWFGHDALLQHLPVEPTSAMTSELTDLLAFSRREFSSVLHALPALATALRTESAQRTVWPGAGTDELFAKSPRPRVRDAVATSQ